MSGVMRFWSKWLLPAAAAVATAMSAAAASAQPRTLCVGKEVVLLRAGPSAKHNPVGSLPAGACGVQVVGKCTAGWCEVGLGSRRGWVDSRLVTVREGSAPAAPPKAAPPVTGAVRVPKQAPPPARPPGYAPPAPQADGHCVMGVERGDTLRIRSGPSVEHREISGIPPGACGVVLRGGCAGYWCPVSYRGVNGWVNATYLRPVWMR